jgi:RND family efflux transporter MFP subunit
MKKNMQGLFMLALNSLRLALRRGVSIESNESDVRSLKTVNIKGADSNKYPAPRGCPWTPQKLYIIRLFHDVSHTNGVLKQKAHLLSMVIFIAAAMLLPWGCTKKKEDTAALKKNPVMVKVEAVERGVVTRSLDYKGTVFPWKQANIQPDTSGRIHKIYKKQGDRVKKGELLAELDTTTQKLQLKQAEAALDVANAAYKDAQMNRERLKTLFQKAAISKLQLEKAELNLEAASTQKQSALATVAVIEHTLGNSYMRAPFAGIITSKNSEEGDVVNPMMGMNSSVLTLMDLNTVKVVLDVPAEDIEKISLEQPCTVRVSNLEADTFAGRVYSRNLAADPTSKTFKVEIKIDNPQLIIKAGVFAEVIIAVAGKENCLILPLSALIEEGDTGYVVLYDNGQAKFKNIRVGERNDRVFEIGAGLSQGQLVVVKGNYDIKNGALITYDGANR